MMYHNCFYCAYLLDCPLNGKGICDDFVQSKVSGVSLRRKYHTNDMEKIRDILRRDEPNIRIVPGKNKNGTKRYTYYLILHKNKAP